MSKFRFSKILPLMILVVIVAASTSNAEEITLTTIMPFAGVFKIATTNNNPGGTVGDIVVPAGGVLTVNVPGIDVKYVIIGAGFNLDGDWTGIHCSRVTATGNGFFQVTNTDIHDDKILSWMAIGE